MQTDTELATLNSLLRGEMSAVETYDQAIEKLTGDTSIAQQLSQCRSSHEKRANVLRNEVARRGGKPSKSSGMWGAFAKLVEGGAKALGMKAALAALEEGEDHGLKQYRDDLPKLDGNVRSALERQLLVEQERTHHAMSALKMSVH